MYGLGFVACSLLDQQSEVFTAGPHVLGKNRERLKKKWAKVGTVLQGKGCGSRDNSGGMKAVRTVVHSAGSCPLHCNDK